MSSEKQNLLVEILNRVYYIHPHNYLYIHKKYSVSDYLINTYLFRNDTHMRVDQLVCSLVHY